MIRLGMMVRETQQHTIAESIETARRLDLDAVDIHMSGLSREPADLLAIRRNCLQAGLDIGYAGGGTFVGPPEQSGQRLAQGRADVDAAVFLGARLLRVFARHKWPDTVEEQEALWTPMIDSFQQICDYAAERGLSVALQNHNNGSFAMTAQQVLRILQETDRPNFSFLLDTGQWLGSIGSHPRGESDPAVDIYRDYIEPTAPHATYVRAKIYKIDSGKEEFLDYERILRILRTVDYNGTLGLVFELGEFNSCDYDECVRLAVAHLRHVIAGSEATS